MGVCEKTSIFFKSRFSLGESMIIEISVAVAVVIFAVLAIILINTLITLQRTLKQVEELTFETRMKLGSLDSTFEAIANLGDVVEQKSECLKEKVLEREMYRREDTVAEDLADWLRASVKLGAKYLTRR